MIRIARRRFVRADPTFIAISQQTKDNVDSSFLQGTHKVVMVLTGINGVYSNGVDTELTEVLDVRFPTISVLIGEEIDTVCYG